MAYIKHYWRAEKVYKEFSDGGCRFHDWTVENVEHYSCSACGAGVGKRTSFCPHCGVKLSGVKEQYKKTSCKICGAEFTQLAHKEEWCCPRCQSLFMQENGFFEKGKTEIAKTFYELGKAEAQSKQE